MLNCDVVCSQGSWPSPIAAESVVLTEISSLVEYSAQHRGTGQLLHSIRTAAIETVPKQVLLKVEISAPRLRAGMLHVILCG
jgi:hypothetical protein